MKYVLYLTYKCNWNCEYCSEDTHNRPDISFEKIKQNILDIEDYSSVDISGGEPGYVKSYILEYVYNELRKKNCSIGVNTNGLFFEKYPQYIDITDTFFYHVSENLSIHDKIKIINHSNVEYMIVVTDNNIVNLDSFLNKHKNIKFTVYGADARQYNWGKTVSLSRSNGIKIASKYKDRISKSSISNLLMRNDVLMDIKKISSKREDS